MAVVVAGAVLGAAAGATLGLTGGLTGAAIGAGIGTAAGLGVGALAYYATKPGYSYPSPYPGFGYGGYPGYGYSYSGRYPAPYFGYYRQPIFYPQYTYGPGPFERFVLRHPLVFGPVKRRLLLGY
jgi:hypothetical protein